MHGVTNNSASVSVPVCQRALDFLARDVFCTSGIQFNGVPKLRCMDLIFMPALSKGSLCGPLSAFQARTPPRTPSRDSPGYLRLLRRNPPSTAQGGKGVVVPGCPPCLKRINTMAQFPGSPFARLAWLIGCSRKRARFAEARMNRDDLFERSESPTPFSGPSRAPPPQRTWRIDARTLPNCPTLFSTYRLQTASLFIVLVQFTANRRQGAEKAIRLVIRTCGKEQSVRRAGTALVAELKCPQPVDIH